MAGFGGQRLLGLGWFGINLTSILAFVAGLILLREGLITAGVMRRAAINGTASICGTGGVLRALLKQRSHLGLFLAGIANGFLPCGLVYAFLLIAARTSDMLLGAANAFVHLGGLVRCHYGVLVDLPRLGLYVRRRSFRLPVLYIDVMRGIALSSEVNPALSGSEW
jgi:sulfite exporter TauE/SafE